MLKFVDDGWMKVPSQMTTAAWLLAIVLGSLSLSGCEDPTIWSSETRSANASGEREHEQNMATFALVCHYLFHLPPAV
jgi:hypothetical protein